MDLCPNVQIFVEAPFSTQHAVFECLLKQLPSFYFQPYWWRVVYELFVNSVGAVGVVADDDWMWLLKNKTYDYY